MEAIAVSAEFAQTVTWALTPAAVQVVTELRGSRGSVDWAVPEHAALIQFSSGSTARPKGIVISPESLSAHVDAIARWLGVAQGTPMASWIPLHHDMGLIGCLLTSMTAGTDLWLMRPENFLRRPLEWLRCFGQGDAMTSAVTSSGLEYLLQRVGPHQLEGMDFSRWQALVVGAERIRPDVIRSFRDLLAPFGFRPSAIVPAYGLAEATLAVTGSDIRSEPEILRLDTDRLALGQAVRDAAPGGNAVEVVSCGRPLPGTSLRIVSTDGAALPERHLGEIEVCGPSVAVGYAEQGAVPAEEFCGRLMTGDAGFLIDGALYVIGRIGDGLSVRGQRVFAEDLELVLRHCLPRLGEPVVLLGTRAAQDMAVVLIERGDAELAADVARILLAYLPGVDMQVRRTPRRAILRTTSGKPCRRRMWHDLSEDTLAGENLWPPSAQPTQPPHDSLAATRPVTETA
jgi:acyl-CoA synthetase (AMP-forming)/AMP-acid ligase II